MKTPVLAVLSLLCFTVASRAEKWKRAEIRLLDWDVDTFRRVDPADIKEGFKKVFTTDAQEFADTLELDKLAPVKEARPEDARLVIELTSEKGAVVTYYASRFNLCTLDNKSKRPIDEAFRKRFTDLSRKQDAREPKKEGAIVDGPHYAFTVTAPAGWKMTSTEDIQAAFHPADKSFKESDVIMYVRSSNKKELKISKVEELNRHDLKGLQEHSPEAKSEKTDTAKIASGREIPVYSFTYDGYHERVAYADEAKTITVFVLSAKSPELLKASRPAFNEMVASYTFLSDEPASKDKPAKAQKAPAK